MLIDLTFTYLPDAFIQSEHFMYTLYMCLLAPIKCDKTR